MNEAKLVCCSRPHTQSPAEKMLFRDLEEAAVSGVAASSFTEYFHCGVRVQSAVGGGRVPPWCGVRPPAGAVTLAGT